MQIYLLFIVPEAIDELPDIIEFPRIRAVPHILALSKINESSSILALPKILAFIKTSDLSWIIALSKTAALPYTLEELRTLENPNICEFP